MVIVYILACKNVEEFCETSIRLDTTAGVVRLDTTAGVNVYVTLVYSIHSDCITV